MAFISRVPLRPRYIRQRPCMLPCLAPVPYLLLYLVSFERADSRLLRIFIASRFRGCVVVNMNFGVSMKDCELVSTRVSTDSDKKRRAQQARDGRSDEHSMAF